jgi:regulator of RNase E activity RraA
MTTLLDQIARLETSMLADIDKSIRAMDARLRRINPGRKLIGRARTAACRNDFLTVMRVLADAGPGDVLVIDGRGGNLALAGEMFAMEAARKKLGGLSSTVVSATQQPCRTSTCRSTPASSTRRRHHSAGRCHSGARLVWRCGGQPRRHVFADADGVICGTDAEFEALVEPASGLMQNEEKAYAAFKQGTGLMDMLNFEEHFAARAAGKPSDLKYLL